jgi:bla regulator protein blaR1
MNNELTRTICWTLLHSLWQGLLLTLLAGVVILFTQKASATIRYRLLLVLFIAFLLTCGYTFIQEWHTAGTGGAVSISTLPVAALWQKIGMGQLATRWIQYCSDHALLIVTGWLLLFVFRCWQMTRAVLYIHHIRRSNFYDAGPYWNNRLRALAQQLNIQQTVLLLESGATKIPVVIGHLKPIIYMPLGLLSNLPADQIEAVLLHELAHIRRHDFLINLLQHIAEALFFFNPGLLWVSALLKQERENCCDDVALRYTRKKKLYIEALISFREHAVYANSYATAFPGKKSQLQQRVMRIIGNRNHSLTMPEKIFFLSSLLMAVVLLITTGHRTLPVDHTRIAQQVPVIAESKKIIVIQKEQSLVVENRLQQRRKETHKQAPITPKEPPVSTAPAPVITPLEEDKQSRAAEVQKQQALDRRRADEDRARAALDRQQADKDRAQADLDRQQAMKDRQQADRDRAQAALDRQQADRDRQQAIKDRAQAERDRMVYAQQKAAD